MINKNIHKNQKWDHELRKHLFLTLLFQFGKHNEENKPDIKDVQAVCSEFTNRVNQELGLDISEKGGAMMQYAWAITKQEKAEGGQAGLCMLAKAAAHDAGFISIDMLPEVLLMEYK